MIDIEHKPVTSSNIESVGYDADSQTLAVKFKNGGTYHYAEVPKEKYEEMIAARSVGGYLHANVKGVHKHTKM